MARRARKTKEVARRDDAPEFFNGCKFYKIMQCQVTHQTFPQSCGLCDGCRHHKHESLVSRGLAEAQSAAATLFVTLTYEDDEKGECLDYKDVQDFVKRINHAVHGVRILSAGEYGSRHGRAHWHVLLYFQWDEEHLTQWKKEQVEIDGAGAYKGDSWHERRVKDWPKYCPKMRMGRIRDKRAFMAALADPESLWVDTIGQKNAGEYPQKWRFWPWGNVEARIVSAPNVGTEQEQNKAVRYAVKYATKDPWKDGKLRHKPFEELPEHVKQATAYGPWDLDGTNERTKWVRGNRHVKELEKELLQQFQSDDDVPLHRRIKRHRYNYSPRGGLGRDYFECLGAWYASKAGSQEELVNRIFKIGPSYRRQRDEFYRDGFKWQNVEKAIRNAETPSPIQKKNQFYMGDTAYRQFARGFNAYLQTQGKAETTGPDHIFDNLDTKAKRYSDIASGHLGLTLWEKDHGTPGRNAKHRKTLEKVWADIPAERLRTLVPQRLQRLLEETSKEKGWQLKRRKRLLHEKYGAVRHTYGSGLTRIVETTKKRFFYEKYLKPNDLWYRREILTIEQLLLAQAGKLPAENARAIRIEKEGKGDLRLLSDLDIRTIRKRLR